MLSPHADDGEDSYRKVCDVVELMLKKLKLVPMNGKDDVSITLKFSCDGAKIGNMFLL